MIADMLSNKKLNAIVTELFIGEQKTKYISSFYYTILFCCSKNFVMKIPNKRELQQIAFNHSSDIDFQNFMNLYKKSSAEPYSFFGY